MKVFIYAYEDIYGGMHGINTSGVFEVENLKEANDTGKELAYEVIESFGHIFEDYNEDEVYDGLEWKIYPIKDIFKDTFIITLDRMSAELGPEIFIEEYCGEEIF